MPKQIIFVRHGETDLNKEKRLMNWVHDVGALSELGRTEAAEVGRKLKKYKIHTMYASDLLRTRQTAEIISREIGLQPVFTEYLRERNLGIFGDLTFDEIKSKWPERLTKFLDHSDIDWNGLEGESLRNVHDRFRQFLAILESKHPDENLLFVTHSGFLYTTLRDVFGLLPQNTWLDVAHTSITIVERIDGRYHLKLFNEA